MDSNFKIVQTHQNGTRVDSASVRYIIILVLHIRRLQQIHGHVDVKRFHLHINTNADEYNIYINFYLFDKNIYNLKRLIWKIFVIKKLSKLQIEFNKC